MSDSLTVNQCVAIALIVCACVTGPRAGLWTVIPCQLIVMIGLDIVYCVTAGKSMQFLYQHTCHGWRDHTCTSFGLSAWIVVFAAIQMLLSTVSFVCPLYNDFCLPTTCVCVYVYAYTCMCTCLMYVYMYVCIYVFIHIYVCVYCSPSLTCCSLHQACSLS